MGREPGTGQEYDAAKIQVLKGLEGVRKRPAMYIGSTSARGLHHLVYEVVDNSVDEVLAGVCTDIEVTIHADNSITVKDNGRGIPVDEHPVQKRPAVEVVMTVLHAGGKFDDKSYKVSGGLHGVGVSVVNALSEWLEVEVRRDGKRFRQRYARGEVVHDLEVVGKSEDTGTTVKFKPDATVFEETEFSYDTLSQRLRELAFLNAGLKILITDERSGKKHEFKFDGGIVEFVKTLNHAKETLHPDAIYLHKTRDE
ncbi:MAG TPA: ATP-binding protein, partial [Candidatus Eisenbacteria bacterium]